MNLRSQPDRYVETRRRLPAWPGRLARGLRQHPPHPGDPASDEQRENRMTRVAHKTKKRLSFVFHLPLLFFAKN